MIVSSEKSLFPCKVIFEKEIKVFKLYLWYKLSTTNIPSMNQRIQTFLSKNISFTTRISHS